MAEILELAVVDSLAWVHKEDLAELGMFALFATTNTKAVPVHGVDPKCKERTFS